MDIRDLTIRQAYHEGDEWDRAMEVAWRTFQRFEASDYTQEGVDSFRSFITDDILHRMFRVGSYELFLAMHDGDILGMITLRNISHISLLFVEEAYHRRGIGRALVEYVETYLKEETGASFITVDSSPYGIAFYESLGFIARGGLTTTQGITYLPMKLEL